MYFCINTLSPHKFWASMKATRFLQYPTDVNSFHSRAMFLSPEASPSFCGVELVPLVYGCGKPGRAFLIPMPCFGRGGEGVGWGLNASVSVPTPKNCRPAKSSAWRIPSERVANSAALLHVFVIPLTTACQNSPSRHVVD